VGKRDEASCLLHIDCAPLADAEKVRKKERRGRMNGDAYDGMRQIDSSERAHVHAKSKPNIRAGLCLKFYSYLFHISDERQT